MSDSRSSPEARFQILMTRSPAPVANHLLPGSTATLGTQPKCPEITHTSFHGAWYVGLTVRVVLCSVSACQSLEALVNVETHCSGVVLMEVSSRSSQKTAQL